MAGIDVFADDAFGLVELTAALEEVEYKPQQLGQMGIFTSRSVRTEKVSIEKKNQVLTLVPVTERGSPLPQLTQGRRDIRDFRTVRVGKGDHLTAAELAGIRAFGTDSEFVQVQQEVLTRSQMIRDDLELTHEHMRLGAIQGILLDADGSVIYNWFDEWDITQPAEMVFNFATLIDGAFRKKCADIIRTMAKAAKGAWGPGTQVVGMCGDQFYDELISNAEVRATYLGWTAAADLRQASFWEPFPFGNIQWMNYRGTDDGSKVAIPTDKVKFFPINAPEAFLRVNSPGESFDVVNTPGQEFYARTIPDEKRNEFVDIEVVSYPLYIATRPGMLLRGRLA